MILTAPKVSSYTAWNFPAVNVTGLYEHTINMCSICFNSSEQLYHTYISYLLQLQTVWFLMF